LISTKLNQAILSPAWHRQYFLNYGNQPRYT